VSINVKARINARKIVLVYFYEQYFLEIASTKDSLLDEIDKIHRVVDNKAPAKENIDMRLLMSKNYYGADVDDELAYIIENYFRKFEPSEIDFEYINLISPKFHDYQPTVSEKVNEYTVTFKYDEMDLIDRVLFVLGYIEYTELRTPKEVMLNEMVELAKRYGDDSSSKLINGIGHKVLSSIDEDPEGSKIAPGGKKSKKTSKGKSVNAENSENPEIPEKKES